MRYQREIAVAICCLLCFIIDLSMVTQVRCPNSQHQLESIKHKMYISFSSALSSHASFALKLGKTIILSFNMMYFHSVLSNSFNLTTRPVVEILADSLMHIFICR